MAKQTYLTRADEVGDGSYDSIEWLFSEHIHETDSREFNYAVVHGNEDSPSRIELWKGLPHHDTPADRVWLPADVIRPYGPGKFSTMLDAYVYSVSLDGGCDEEESFGDGEGWYGLMRHGSTIFRDHDPMLETLNAAEQKQLTESAGVILREDSQGFVYVDYYDTDKELDSAWAKIQAEFSDNDQRR